MIKSPSVCDPSLTKAVAVCRWRPAFSRWSLSCRRCRRSWPRSRRRWCRWWRSWRDTSWRRCSTSSSGTRRNPPSLRTRMHCGRRATAWRDGRASCRQSWRERETASGGWRETETDCRTQWDSWRITTRAPDQRIEPGTGCCGRETLRR